MNVPARREARAVALLILGASCIGFAPLLARIADVGPVASAFWRMALAAPVLWLVVWLRSHGAVAAHRPAPGLLRMMWVSGLFFAADLAVWHVSIAYTSIANSTLLANCAPILATVYAFVVHRQRPSAMFLAAMLLAMTGATMLVGPNFQLGGRALAGDLLALLASVFYTSYMIAIHRAQASGDMLRLLAASSTVTALALLPAAWLLSVWQGQPFWPASLTGWSTVIALALVSQVLGQGCIAYGLTHMPVALSATILLLQPLVAAAAAWILLNERLGMLQMAGGALLLLAIYMARRTAR